MRDVQKKMIKPVSATDLENLNLGEDNALLGFASREETQKLAATIIAQASHKIVYLGSHLESAMLGESNVIEAIEKLLLGNRTAEFKILVNSSYQLVHAGHRLVEVLRRFMPQVECRLRRPGNNLFEGAFVLIDDCGYLYQPDPDRFSGSASFNAVSTVTKLSDVFVEEWQTAEPDPEMQPLNI